MLNGSMKKTVQNVNEVCVGYDTIFITKRGQFLVFKLADDRKDI